MIKTLICIRLRSAFSSFAGMTKDGKLKKTSKGKIVLFSLLYLYLAVFLIAAFFGMAMGLSTVLLPLGLDWLYFAIFTLVALAFLFVLGIFETKSQLFECKDNELLLSMPIKPRHIILSRIFTLLIYNYLECAAVMLPAVVCYLVNGGSALGAIGTLFVILLLPLFALSLSSAVGYAVALLAKKFKRNTFMTVAVSIAFLALYFYVYNEFLSFTASGEMSEEQIAALANKFAIFEALGSIALLNPIYTPLFCVLCLGSAALAYYLISRSYISIVTANHSGKRNIYKNKTLVKRSALSAVVRKELKKFFSSAAYMLNSAMGIIFTVFLSVLVLINKNDINSVIDYISSEVGVGVRAMIFPLAICLIALVGSMNLISAASVSLEGKNLWILKSLPVSANQILIAKSLMHVIVTTPATLIASVCAIIALEVPIEYISFFVVIPLLSNVIGALLGTLINVAFPKFDFQNEAVPIKQSLSVFLTMTGMMLFEIVIGIGAFLLTLFGLPMLTTVLILLLKLVICVVLMLIMIGPASRRFEKFSA